MSGPDIDDETMKPFRRSGIDKHITILLGAGASVTSGLPDWDTFATRLLVKNDLTNDKDVARELLTHQDPLIVVEAVRSKVQESWAQKLRLALYDDEESIDSLDPSPLHLAAAGRYLSAPRTTSLVTLNFDTLLEKALELEVKERVYSLTSVEPDTSAEPDKNPSVYHLHGIITPNETKDVILTLNDFTNLIAKESAWQTTLLNQAISKGAIIIAGTSYRDPDLRQWLYAALQNNAEGHKAFVLLAREAFGVTKEKFRKLQGILSAQWRAVGLEPILLQDHTDAAQIIKEISYNENLNYFSPSERSRSIWKAHSQNFEAKQDEYVRQLDEDSTTLKERFQVETINLTLWISDGDGKLVKWASQDRIHRDQSSLRSVETGHDSPWVAGRAMGADTLLFEDLDQDHTRRWRSVLAAPLPVSVCPDLPSVSSAVLTVGLPETAETFRKSDIDWGSAVARIADNWGDRLSKSASEKQ